MANKLWKYNIYPAVPEPAMWLAILEEREGQNTVTLNRIQSILQLTEWLFPNKYSQWRQLTHYNIIFK